MKRLLFCFTLFFSLLILSSIVLADGGIYSRVITFDKDVWVPITQNEQVSIIEYKDGKESMIISVEGELEESEIAWFFPVPAKPEQTDIDIIKEFHNFSGYEVKSKVGYEITKRYSFIYLSQIYPEILNFFVSYGIYGVPEGAYVQSIRGVSDQDTGVVIHEHLERGGLTTELVTTKDEAQLYAYIQQKDLNLPTESLSIVREYIGKDYSFVVSWISDGLTYRRETGGNVLGVKVVFPTNDIFYPLKLTSIYGETEIPMSIYVSGHVSPKIFSEIEDYTDVKYYRGKEDYTKININAESRLFVQDFWISKSTPLDILFADIILISPTIFLVVVFAIVSSLSSIISGFVFYRKDFSWKNFALLGLGNFLTIIGFSIATFKTIKSKNKMGRGLKLFASAFVLSIIVFVLSIVTLNVILFLISLGLIPLSFLSMLFCSMMGDRRFAFISGFSIMFVIISYIFGSMILSAYPYTEIIKDWNTIITEDHGYIVNMNFIIEFARCDPSNNEIKFSIRNIGTGNIESVSTYVDDKPMDNDSNLLPEGGLKTFSIKDVNCEEVVGKNIKIVAPSGLTIRRIIE